MEVRSLELLTTIVTDLATLRSAYSKAGLLGDASPGSAICKLLGVGDDIDRFRRDFLLLDAMVRHRIARVALDRSKRRHVVVFGGNNVGKSTVINILATSAVASASPEGGHTRHAQAFVADSAPLFGENNYAFHRFTRVPSDKLPPGRFDSYGVSNFTSEALPRDVILWDTPDCDASGSTRYLDAVVEVVAAADLVLYVSSVERYAVAHLVEWLFQLHDMGTPIVQCLNKTSRRDRDPVVRKQTEDVFPTMAAQLGMSVPRLSIVALKYLIDGEESDLWGPDHPEAAELRQTALTTLDQTDREAAGRAALDCVLRRVSRVLEPAWMEVMAHHKWRSIVDAAITDFVAAYERDYLTSDTVIEPFSRLTLEILHLLDPNIRGLKEAMRVVRWATSWPSKLVLVVGRQVMRLSSGDQAPHVAPELKACTDAHIGLLNALGHQIDVERRAARHHPFWDSIASEWEERLHSLGEEFGMAASAHMKRSEEEIKAAARDIFHALEQQPATLHFLRGARVAATVGGTLVGIVVPHIGGIVYDVLEEALITPAILTVTETATTHTVQGFVGTRKKRIVERLRQEAYDMANSLYRDALVGIAESAMARAGALGVNRELLDRLPSDLRRLKAQMTEHAA